MDNMYISNWKNTETGKKNFWVVLQTGKLSVGNVHH